MVGLGNPGPEYDDTRHNVGWWLVDRAVHDWGLAPFERNRSAWTTEGVVDGCLLRVVKPATYMNRSGAAIRTLAEDPEFSPAEDLLVVVDDAALEVGRIRLRPRGGPGGHNGLRSISEALGTDEYPRLRIGVGSPPRGKDWAEWVLSPMDGEEEEVLLNMLPEVVKAVEVWIREGVEAAMNRYNR